MCDGFVRRTVFVTVPPTVEYRLTPLGESLLPPFVELVTWAERHHAAVRSAREQSARQTATRTAAVAVAQEAVDVRATDSVSAPRRIPSEARRRAIP